MGSPWSGMGGAHPAQLAEEAARVGRGETLAQSQVTWPRWARSSSSSPGALERGRRPVTQQQLFQEQMCPLSKHLFNQQTGEHSTNRAPGSKYLLLGQC